MTPHIKEEENRSILCSLDGTRIILSIPGTLSIGVGPLPLTSLIGDG
ncbi:MAG: hypothetical protein ACRC10_10905 [Thermoguttaceae bacterium]